MPNVAAKLCVVGCTLSLLSSAVARPTVDRESARLDALQMNVAIPDESDTIGLNHLGGNPAGIVLDEYRSRAALLYRPNQIKRGSLTDYKQHEAGLLGIFRNETQAVRFEAEGILSENEAVSTGAEDERDYGAAELALNQKWNTWLAGGSVEYSNTEVENTAGGSTGSNRTDPVSYNLGVGWTQPVGNRFFDVGFGFRENNLELSGTESNQDSYTLSAIFGDRRDMNVGVVQTFSELETNSDLDSSEQDSDTFKIRGYWHPQNLPLQFGGSFGFANSDTMSLVKNTGATTTLDINDNTTVLGAAWTFLQRSLIGVQTEFGKTNVDRPTSSNESSDFMITGGGELEFLKILIARASYSYFDQTSHDSGNVSPTHIFRNISALGVGAQIGENGKVDVSYKYTEQKDTGRLDRTNQLFVMGTLFFGQ